MRSRRRVEATALNQNAGSVGNSYMNNCKRYLDSTDEHDVFLRAILMLKSDCADHVEYCSTVKVRFYLMTRRMQSLMAPTS